MKYEPYFETLGKRLAAEKAAAGPDTPETGQGAAVGAESGSCAYWSGEATVYGPPATKGSYRAFTPRGSRYPILRNDNERASAWTDRLVLAMKATAPRVPLKEPLRLAVTIYLKRPQSHYGTGKNRYALKTTAPKWPTVKPDWDKVGRLISDAGTGVWWADDNCVHCGTVLKAWDDGEGPRTVVQAWEVMR